MLKDYQKHFGTHSVKTQLENKLIRHFKNLNHSLVKDNKSIIVLASSFELPSDLEKIMPVIDCPLPDKKEIEDKVQDLLSKA